MKMYTAPAFQATAFNCPHCGAYSNMLWAQLGCNFGRSAYERLDLYGAHCMHCSERTFWLAHPHIDGSDPLSGMMILPSSSIAPQPHAEMPEDVKRDYLEAREIVTVSPRGSAALLRLAIQKLCVALGESGTNINQDIAGLVRKGLATEVQQALDIVRVIGNNAVHPGELSIDDVSEVSQSLFELVNFIVEDRIARPKKLAELFGKLPQGAIQQIAKRDLIRHEPQPGSRHEPSGP